MKRLTEQKAITIGCVFLVVGASLFAYIIWSNLQKPEQPKKQLVATTTTTVFSKSTTGYSVLNNPIEAYTFGNGKKHLLFVGGMHGGYEWNSVALAYQAIDYLTANPATIPENITVTIIPSINPDGIYKVTDKIGRFTLADIPKDEAKTIIGRMNANTVDLNRNFDCNWQPKSTWKNKIVSAGTKAFSEPESQTLKNFILKYNPQAVIFWHSQSGAVYASECNDGILPETVDIMNTYSKAANYQALKTFDSYKITGDAEGWLASINIPAITVELRTHSSIEWDQNLPGIKALLNYYTKKI